MSYKVTVIIPCYNAEETLSRSVDSIINQSIGFENIELILYDDSSSDNTRLIIKEYMEKYENIVGIFSDNNSGYPGKGRNTGIKNASSPFVMFMDNDDEYDVEMCEKLFDEITNQDADIVTTDFLNIDDVEIFRSSYRYLDGENFENKVIFSSKNAFYLSNWSIWCCIFKKDILINNEIYFPENKMGEDVYFLLNYYNHVHKSVYLRGFFGLHRYVQNDSLSSNFTIKHLNDFLYLSQLSMDNYRTKDCNIEFIFNNHVSFLILQMCISNVKFDRNELLAFLRKLNIFQKGLNMNQYINSFIFKNINSLIIAEHYNLAIVASKLAKPLYTSKNVKKIYLKLTK